MRLSTGIILLWLVAIVFIVSARADLGPNLKLVPGDELLRRAEAAMAAKMESEDAGAPQEFFTTTDGLAQKQDEEDACEVRMNGRCYDDLDEAVHALNLGRQAGKPAAPKSAGRQHAWTKKKVVISLRGRSRHPGNHFIRPDRDLKSLLITTHGSGKAIIDCDHSGKPGLAFENVINVTTLQGIDIRRCQPGVLFTKAWEGNKIFIERCHLFGNEPDPVHSIMSVLIDSDKDFDHPINGLPLRYTDEEIRRVWLSEDQGLANFPTQLAKEDVDLIKRIKLEVRKSLFRTDVPEYAPPIHDALVTFDNGMEFYLNKIYKKVGVKTTKTKVKRAHMLSLRRLEGTAHDSHWDLEPAFRPNEVDHNSPSFRRVIADKGIY